MKTIKNDTRRITKFIIEEAYKWVYDNIDKYSFKATTKTKKLLSSIRSAQKVTEESYGSIVAMFGNNPIENMVKKKRRISKEDRITSEYIFCYFVCYNGVILPLGFVKDFFEDDYETQKEIGELVSEMMETVKSEIKNRVNANIAESDVVVNELKESRPEVYRVNIRMYLYMAVRILITISFFWLFLKCINELRIVEVILKFFTDSNLNFDSELSIGRGITIFRKSIPYYFTYQEYFSEFSFWIIANASLSVILITRSIRIITGIVFFVKLAILKIKLLCVKTMMHVIGSSDNKFISQLESAVDKISEIIAEDPEITMNSQLCSYLPKRWVIRMLIKTLTVNEFNALADKLPNYGRKRYLASNKNGKLKYSKKGMFSTIVLLIFFAAINVPELYDIMIDTYVSLTGITSSGK